MSDNDQMSVFEKRLRQGVVRCDGSMGYVLVRQGVPRDRSFDFLNVERPEAVAKVHRAYLDSAAVDVIQTNTFGANRLHLATFGRGHENLVDVVNREGVRIARAAVEGTDCLVAGSVGPLTHITGDAISKAPDPLAIREAYAEQIDALGKNGVDLFIIETIHRFEEGITALECAREAFPEIPVVFQITSSRRGETVAGDDVETLVRAADERGATSIGFNCFLDPAEMYEKILELREWTNLPMAAQPNVGKRGNLCQGVFEAERSLKTTVRTYATRFVEAGVRMIGGCCGITPQHIELVRHHISKVSDEDIAGHDAKRQSNYLRSKQIMVGFQGRRQDAKPTRLEADLDEGLKRPILFEVDPPRVDEDLSKILAGVQRLVDAGIRTITVADNPGRVPRLDRLVFSRMLLDLSSDLELIIHISCADRTLVNFATEIESLQHLSRNVLVISGDPPEGDFSRSSAPYDFRSVSGIRAFSRRNFGIDVNGRDDLPPTHYYVGAALNPRALAPQMRKFWTKSADAGAGYCLTQPIFDEGTLRSLHEGAEAHRERLRTERQRDCHFFPGIMRLLSQRNAEIMRREFGMSVPKTLIAELSELRTRKAQRKRGREICREMLELSREKLPFSGVYIVPQFYRFKGLLEDLRETGWLENA